MRAEPGAPSTPDDGNRGAAPCAAAAGRRIRAGVCDRRRNVEPPREAIPGWHGARSVLVFAATAARRGMQGTSKRTYARAMTVN